MPTLSSPLISLLIHLFIAPIESYVRCFLQLLSLLSISKAFFSHFKFRNLRCLCSLFRIRHRWSSQPNDYCFSIVFSIFLNTTHFAEFSPLNHIICPHSEICRLQLFFFVAIVLSVMNIWRCVTSHSVLDPRAINNGSIVSRYCQWRFNWMHFQNTTRP